MRPIYFAALALLFGSALLFPACKGDTGPAGPPGASSIPTPYCSSPSTHGVTVATVVAGFGTGYLIASPVTLTASSTAVSLSVDISTAVTPEGQLILGLYTNNAGVPGNLVEEGVPQMAVTGWNTSAIPAIDVFPGTYWVAINYSYYQDFETSTSNSPAYAYALYTWGALPTSFPSATASSAAQVLMTVETCP